MDEIKSVDGLEDVDVWELHDLQQHENSEYFPAKTINKLEEKPLITPESNRRALINLGNYKTPEEIQEERELILNPPKKLSAPTRKWLAILEQVKFEGMMLLEEEQDRVWRIIYTSTNSEIMGFATRTRLMKKSSVDCWPTGVWLIRSRKEFSEPERGMGTFIASHTEVKFVRDSDTVEIRAMPRGGRRLMDK